MNLEENKPRPFTQGQLNGLVRDLCLAKEASEIWASARHYEHNILNLQTNITFYWDGDEVLIQYFTKENNFVFSNNVTTLLVAMGLLQHKPDEWRLFIDSSKKSFKCVLLNNGDKFACVPVGHLVVLKEHNHNIKIVLKKLCYSEHKWVICVDFTMVNF